MDILAYLIIHFLFQAVVVLALVAMAIAEDPLPEKKTTKRGVLGLGYGGLGGYGLGYGYGNGYGHGYGHGYGYGHHVPVVSTAVVAAPVVKTVAYPGLGYGHGYGHGYYGGLGYGSLGYGGYGHGLGHGLGGYGGYYPSYYSGYSGFGHGLGGYYGHGWW